MVRKQVRRSPVDGMYRVWERVWASSLVDLDGAWVYNAHPSRCRSDGSRMDWQVWVQTGVFKTRKECFS